MATSRKGSRRRQGRDGRGDRLSSFDLLLPPDVEAKAAEYDQQLGELLADLCRSTGRTWFSMGEIQHGHSMGVPQVRSFGHAVMR